MVCDILHFHTFSLLKKMEKSIIWTGDHVGLASNIDGLHCSVQKRERMESVVGCKLQLTYHVIVKLEGSFLQSCPIVIEFFYCILVSTTKNLGDSNSLKLTHLLHQLSIDSLWCNLY
jgi:hypothetical protein